MIAPDSGDSFTTMVSRWEQDCLCGRNPGALFTFGEELLGNVSTSTVMVVTLENGRVYANHQR